MPKNKGMGSCTMAGYFQMLKEYPVLAACQNNKLFSKIEPERCVCLYV